MNSECWLITHSPANHTLRLHCSAVSPASPGLLTVGLSLPAVPDCSSVVSETLQPSPPPDRSPVAHLAGFWPMLLLMSQPSFLRLWPLTPSLSLFACGCLAFWCFDFAQWLSDSEDHLPVFSLWNLLLESSFLGVSLFYWRKGWRRESLPLSWASNESADQFHRRCPPYLSSKSDSESFIYPKRAVRFPQSTNHMQAHPQCLCSILLKFYVPDV